MRAIAVATTILIATYTGAVSGQSLADLAKKTEEQRADKDKPKAGRVITNKDLKEPIVGGVGSADSSAPAQQSKSAIADEADANAGPAPSASAQDKMRVDAIKLFERSIDEIRQAQATLAGARAQYSEGCAGQRTVAMHTVVGPFGLSFLVPEVTLNETTPTCRVIATDIGRLARQIVSTTEDVRETARTKGIWPGVVREILDPVLSKR